MLAIQAKEASVSGDVDITILYFQEAVNVVLGALKQTGQPGKVCLSLGCAGVRPPPHTLSVWARAAAPRGAPAMLGAWWESMGAVEFEAARGLPRVPNCPLCVAQGPQGAPGAIPAAVQSRLRILAARTLTDAEGLQQFAAARTAAVAAVAAGAQPEGQKACVVS